MPSDFDNMSEMELRARYAELFPGRTVPPITGSTKTQIINRLEKAERGEYHTSNSPSPSRNKSTRASNTPASGRNLRSAQSDEMDDSSLQVHESRRRTPPRMSPRVEAAPRKNVNSVSPPNLVADEKVAPIKSRKATPPRVSSSTPNRNSSRIAAANETLLYTPSNDAKDTQSNIRLRSAQSSSNGSNGARLSDAEIRNKLALAGYDNPPPITDSNRSILIKKAQEQPCKISKSQKKSDKKDNLTRIDSRSNDALPTDEELRAFMLQAGYGCVPPITDSNRNFLIREYAIGTRKRAHSDDDLTTNNDEISAPVTITTDEELRALLVEAGYSNPPPITDSNRHLLIKRAQKWVVCTQKRARNDEDLFMNVDEPSALSESNFVNRGDSDLEEVEVFDAQNYAVTYAENPDPMIIDEPYDEHFQDTRNARCDSALLAHGIKGSQGSILTDHDTSNFSGLSRSENLFSPIQDYPSYLRSDVFPGEGNRTPNEAGRSLISESRGFSNFNSFGSRGAANSGRNLFSGIESYAENNQPAANRERISNFEKVPRINEDTNTPPASYQKLIRQNICKQSENLSNLSRDNFPSELKKDKFTRQSVKNPASFSEQFSSNAEDSLISDDSANLHLTAFMPKTPDSENTLHRGSLAFLNRAADEITPESVSRRGDSTPKSILKKRSAYTPSKTPEAKIFSPRDLGGHVSEPDSPSAYPRGSQLARPAIWKTNQVTPDFSASRAAMDNTNWKKDSSYRKAATNSASSWSKFFGYFSLALIVILLGLAIFYQRSSDLMVQKCSVSGISRVSCVPDAEVDKAVEMYKAVYDMLKEHALDVICRRGEEYVGKSKQDVANFMKEEFYLVSYELDDMISNIKIIAKEHAHGLIKVGSDGRFYANNVNIPFTCKITNYFSYVKHLTIGGIALLAVYLVFSYRRKCQQQNKRKVSELIENIVAILRRNAETSRSPFMPLNHVRDQLIPTSERQKMKKLWEEAVDYVNTSDSRIRREVQSIHGEDYHVWRWLAGPSFAPSQPAPSSGSSQLPARKRGWHGEAFATTQGTINSPFTSPTCCLKVRNMFDPAKEEMSGNGDWSDRIRNEILERCDVSDIVHVAVIKDSKEGVVYVKCASMEDAGNAYRRLHGAWFDDQIIHVKYIRTERYTERFPESQFMVDALHSH